jgi:exonuclease III
MRLLSWNIQAGGGVRLPRIVEEISAYDADIIALTAFRTKTAKALCDALRDRGWPYVENSNPGENENGVAVFAQTPMLRARPNPAPAGDRFRWLDIDFPEYGFGIAVLNIMAAVPGKKAAKIRIWNALVQAAEERLREPFLLAGNWNTGAHYLDEPGKTYVCDQQFARLSTLGWSDLWRRFHPGGVEGTWYSRRKGGVPGNPFRVDHAFATPGLLPRINSCRYSHAEREAGVSDHSIVLVEWE